MITKLPTFVKEPVGAIEWFNRDKINELVDVVNGLPLPRINELENMSLGLKRLIARVDKLEKHKHNFDTDDIELYTQIETSEPIFSELVDLKGTMKERIKVETYSSNTSEPISDNGLPRPASSSDYIPDGEYHGCHHCGQCIMRKVYQELQAVIKECYLLGVGASSHHGNFQSAVSEIMFKLKPYISEK